jgi:hypothetical protein
MKKKTIFGIVALLVIAQPQLVYATAGQWSANGSAIYYNDGKVGFGTSSPADPIHVLTINPSGSALSKEGKILSGDGTGSWWIYGATNAADGYGLNNIASNAYLNNGWQRRVSGYESWILSNYITSNNSGYFRIFHSDAQAGSAITNLRALLSLSPNGTLYTKAVVVSNSWSDYVFDKNYQVMPLSEVRKYIAENKHLPGIPSADEIEQDGISLGDISQKQMAKIEELTLYAIQQEEKLKKLESKNLDLEARLSNLENLVKDN